MPPSRGDLPGRLAPVLLALWPVLFVAGNNPGEFSGIELAVTAVIAGVLGVHCALLGGVLVRGRYARHLVGVVAVVLLYAPFLVAPLARAEVLRPIPGIALLLYALLAALAALAIVRLRRAGDGSPDVARAVGMGALALVAIAGVGAARSVRESLPAASAPLLQGRPAVDSLPDIYVVVLDQYASSAVMRWRFGFDNAEFEDSLRALGFRLPAVTWSNYSFTAASVASLLDMRHVAGIVDGIAADARSLVPLNLVIGDNRAFRVAREHGYRIVFVPSPAFHGTREHAGADRVIRTHGAWEWLAVQATSPLGVQAVKLTAIGAALERLDIRIGSPWRELAPYSGLRAAVAEPGPKLVFAHAMTTHEPFFFTGACEWAPRGARDYHVHYVEQVRCANRQLLDVITAIRHGGRPSVILLQGDHGTTSLGSRDVTQADSVSAAQVKERFGAFMAYRLPTGASLGDTITPVNVLRRIFNRHLGTAFPAEPDAAFFSPQDRPFDLVEVDTRALLEEPAGVSREPGSGVAPAVGRVGGGMDRRQPPGASVAQGRID